MNINYYYGGTILIYIIEIALAIFIEDIGVVFQFGAAISGTSVQFIWPGYFYLHAERVYSNPGDRETRKWTRFLAWAYMITGICLFFGLLGGTFYNIAINSQEAGH